MQPFFILSFWVLLALPVRALSLIGCEAQTRSLTPIAEFLVRDPGGLSSGALYTLKHFQRELEHDLVLDIWETNPVEKVTEINLALPLRESAWHLSQVIDAVYFADKKYERRDYASIRSKLARAAAKYLPLSTYYIVRRKESPTPLGSIRMIKSPYRFYSKSGEPVLGFRYVPLMMESPEFLNVELPKAFSPDSDHERIFLGWNIEVGVYAVEETLGWPERSEIHSTLVQEIYRDSLGSDGSSYASFRRHYFTYGDEVSAGLYSEVGFDYLRTYKVDGLWRVANDDSPKPIVSKDDDGTTKNWWPFYMSRLALEDRQEFHEERNERGRHRSQVYAKKREAIGLVALNRDFAHYVRDLFDGFESRSLEESQSLVRQLGQLIDRDTLKHFGVVASENLPVEQARESFYYLLRAGKAYRWLMLKSADFLSEAPNERSKIDFYYYVQQVIFKMRVREWGSDGRPYIWDYNLFIKPGDYYFAPIMMLENQSDAVFWAAVEILRQLYQNDGFFEFTDSLMDVPVRFDEVKLLALKRLVAEDFKPAVLAEAAEVHEYELKRKGFPVAELTHWLKIARLMMAGKVESAREFRGLVTRLGRQHMSTISSLLALAKIHEITGRPL